MKKIMIKLAAVLILIVMLLPVTKTYAEENDFLHYPGDVNEDKSVDLSDAHIALRIALKIENEDNTVAKTDLNADGLCTLEDAKTILNLALKITKMPPYTEVGQNKEFKTIIDAVNYVRSVYPAIGQSNSNPILCTIMLDPGEYQESLDMVGDSGIRFYGKGPVTWKSSASYPSGCFNGYGTNHFYNINFVSTGYLSYCYHYEAAGMEHVSTKNTVQFTNCTFHSSSNTDIGIGAANKNTNIIFKDCSFIGSKAIYFHNSVYANSNSNYIRFENCQGDQVNIDDAAMLFGNGNSTLTVTFRNTTFQYIQFRNSRNATGEFIVQNQIPDNQNGIIVSGNSGGNQNCLFDY